MFVLNYLGLGLLAYAGSAIYLTMYLWIQTDYNEKVVKEYLKYIIDYIKDSKSTIIDYIFVFIMIVVLWPMHMINYMTMYLKSINNFCKYYSKEEKSE